MGKTVCVCVHLRAASRPRQFDMCACACIHEPTGFFTCIQYYAANIQAHIPNDLNFYAELIQLNCIVVRQPS